VGAKEWIGDGHAYDAAECTSFVAWAVENDGRPHSKALISRGTTDMWAGTAVDDESHVGDVARRDPWKHGAWDRGHVAYVAAVNPDGTVEAYADSWAARHKLGIDTGP
jgi:surface antigen